MSDNKQDDKTINPDYYLPNAGDRYRLSPSEDSAKKATEDMVPKPAVPSAPTPDQLSNWARYKSSRKVGS